MKKFIAIILSISMFASVMCGCSSNDNNKTTNDSIETNTETNTETAVQEVDISEFPDAQEFDEFEWPAVGLSEKLPVPMWSNRGDVIQNSENLLWVKVGYTTVDDFNEYSTACYDAGFSKNFYQLQDNIYYGENEEGYAVLLAYSLDSYVVIKVSNDTSEWDKWWLE